MNIFYLDKDPVIAAEYHCDKHVVKMIVETTQIISTARQLIGSSGPYKKTHMHHPCVKWVNESSQHYNWLMRLYDSLLGEYTKRYGKIHACSRFRGDIINPPNNLIDNGWKDPPQAIAFVECRQPDTVEAYRSYYKNHKAHFAKWKLGNVPFFMSV